MEMRIYQCLFFADKCQNLIIEERLEQRPDYYGDDAYRISGGRMLSGRSEIAWKPKGEFQGEVRLSGMPVGGICNYCISSLNSSSRTRKLLVHVNFYDEKYYRSTRAALHALQTSIEKMRGLNER